MMHGSPDVKPKFGDLAGPKAKDSNLLPLCVDMDGTLLRTDTLHEGLIALLVSRQVFKLLPRLFVRTRAALKQKVGELFPLDPALLPFNEQLVTYLRQQRAAGRTLVLATAADQKVAQSVSDYLGLFDEVIASDGSRNLKGAEKAAALVERFGVGGFVYAGNDGTDFAPWAAAAQIVIVDAPRAIAARARQNSKVEVEIRTRPPMLRAGLRAMRPHQWVKNLLVLVPLATAHAYGDLSAWRDALCMLAAFCATASGIYLLNDLADLAADRQHPRKRRRPLASGDLSVAAGVTLGATLVGIGVTLSVLVGALPIITAYAAASIAYSVVLKEFPLVDVFMLAGLYTIRVVGGGAATGHLVSIWLLAFSSFIFLSLALTKRTGEMLEASRSSEHTTGRRGYTPNDIPLLQSLGCCASFASSLVLSLFVSSQAAVEQYGSPEVLWAMVPLLLFWQCRMWLATTRGKMHDDPIVYATKDWVSWFVGSTSILMLMSAKLGLISLSSLFHSQ
ncbi:UbiA family prenyltransferase [Roseomonas sp. GCM10028921]